MPSAPDNAMTPPEAPRSSIFLSYASENRDAARLLRDALASSGLDVWYDEKELGGGDAWDQKIRRQIRECTYFMPVISAQTEARREGYFRREWRLAVDRSHDMADDAMFLIPVVIDSTTEAGARVPEKFLAVQWLRAPGGAATPAVRALAARLSSGEHLAAPPVAPPSLVQARRSAPLPPVGAPIHSGAPAAHAGPPPMPPFPPRPAGRHDRLKYLAEVVWWCLSSSWLIFLRMPKWVRLLITLWLLFGVVFKSCQVGSIDRTLREKPSAKTDAEKVAGAQSLRDAAGKLDKLAEDPSAGNLKAGFAKAGAEIARAVSKEVDDDLGWSGQLELVPFTADPADPAAGKLADEVFGRVFSQLSQARPTQVKVQQAGAPAADDAALAEAAAKAGKDYLVLGRNTGSEIVVRLVGARGAATLWKGHFSLEAGDSTELADQICQGLVIALKQKADKS